MSKSRIRQFAKLSFSPIHNFIARVTSSEFAFATTRMLAVIAVLSCGFASGQTLTTLYNFGAVPGDGENPQNGVVFDKAGNMYGTAALGGSHGNGSVFQLSPPANAGDPWTETIIHRFQGTPDGETPESRVVVTKSGSLFGTTYLGGANNMGTVFAAFPPAAPGGPWTEKAIYSFGSVPNDGLNPNAGVVAGNKVLYGVAMNGGASHRGTVFQLAPPANPSDPWIETTLHNFAAGGDAAFPSSELTLDAAGNLFGTTLLGGAHNVGAVYQLAPPPQTGDPWTENVIYSFSGTDGSSPFGRLLLDANGVIYGTTSGGGTGSSGAVYRLTPPVNNGDPWTQAVLYNFSGGKEGGSPSAGVVMDKKGRLFGTARTGGHGGPDFGGVVFVLNPPANVGDPWTERALTSFGGPNGFGPTSTLVLRSEGIYGTTTQGGQFGTGIVFLLTP